MSATDTTACAHLDAHHGIAGEPGLSGCDECGATWLIAAELPAQPFTTDDKVLYSGPTPEIDGKTGVVVGRWTEDGYVIDVEIDGDRWSVHASRLTLVEQDDDLDAPVPYVPVSPRSVRHTNEPCDLTPQFSSQAGVAAHRYSPTRFGALIPSGGAVTQPNPAPSDDTTPSLVVLDRREAAYQRVMATALEWEYADSYPDSPAAMDATEALDALRAAVRAYKAVA